MNGFHHLGIATKSLEAEARAYALLGYEPEAEEFEDPIQGVRGLFMTAPDAPRIELLAPLPDSTTLDPILKRGVKCYHHGYEVPDLEEGIERLTAARARVVREPAEAIAFDYRRVVFLLLPNMWMVELIEAPGRPD